ncbi:MAG: UDP-glucose 4-epimerase [Methanofollis sp.]|nr:UDP-glucose 4-epimerase [Methanofollis sp.]
MFSIVTGGAGFIGSHLVDALVDQGDRVLVIDSLRTGDLAHIKGHLDAGRIDYLHADLLEDGWQERFTGVDRVYHLAADPDVRGSAATPTDVYENNVSATVRVLEAMRTHGVREIVFTSTSTVYGEASVIPTPEDYSPMEPISVYAGSKLAAEAMISSYAHTYGMKAWVFRFANIIGERSNHGVIWDFAHKLKANPTELEILGDGRQIKSYLLVSECVAALLHAVAATDGPFACFNIGSEDWIDVTTIARIVAGEMGISDVHFRYTGGNRGWVGDVPRMQLAVEKLRVTGWRAGAGSEKSVRQAARALVREIC